MITVRSALESAAAPAWHTLDAAELVRVLDVDRAQGLSTGEAARRLVEHGDNELIEDGGRGALRLLWDQVRAVMVLILLAAAALSLLLGKLLEASAIAAIVVLFVALGFVQEQRAERAIAALRRMSAPEVRVRRDGVDTRRRDAAGAGRRRRARGRQRRAGRPAAASSRPACVCRRRR